VLCSTPAYENPFEDDKPIAAFYFNPFETTEDRLTKLEKELIKDIPMSDSERHEIYYQGMSVQMISEFIVVTTDLVKP